MDANCPECGKRIAGRELAGDLAAHMIQDYYCNCAQKGRDRSPKSQPLPAREFLQGLWSFASTHIRTVRSSENRVDREPKADFCPRCGLRIADHSLPGSLTGYLFQDVRCKCKPEADFSAAMSGKFWGLKKEGLGTTFSSSGTSNGSGSQPVIDLAEGAIIDRAYRVSTLIGCGGMGEVYLAEHMTLGKKCAIKVIPPENVTEIGWRRFQLEAKAIAKLEHINLVKVTDLGIHEGCLPYYAMEFVEGHTLADMVAQSERLPLEMAIKIFVQVCDGVHYAHRAGIVHRDIKPANIMVTQSGSGKVAVKVLDFGLAKLTSRDQERQSLTSVGDIFGTPFYMSPEQCSGDKIDSRSDVYSVGCTLFQCLTGRPPFTGHLPVAVVICHQEADPPSLEAAAGAKIVPEAMEVVMAKLLRKNPVERYQTLLELRQDLEKVARGESVLPFYASRRAQASQNKSAVTALAKPAARPTAPVALAALAAISVVGAIMWTYFLCSPIRPRGSAVTTAPANKSVGSAAATYSSLPAIQLDDVSANLDRLAEGDSDLSSKSLIAPKSLSDPTPFSTIVSERGRSYRLFKFPADIYLGAIGAVDGGGPWRQASGDFKFAENLPVIFEPFASVSKYPGYLKRFRPGDISDIEAIVDQVDPNKLIHTLADLPGLPKLRSWAILQSRRLDSKSLAVINTCTALERLQCTETAIDANTLSKLPRLDSLEILILDDYQSTDVILHRLKNCRKTKALMLKHCAATEAGFADIASMPNLEFLDAASCIGRVSDLAILSKAPRLAFLQVGGKFPMNSEAIKVLQSFKSLNTLEVESNKPVYSPALRQRLRQALPHVLVIDGRGGVEMPMLPYK
jgi:serine/threonine protein kinase